MWAFVLITIGLTLSDCAHGQSNYDNQINSIEYQGTGLPETSILDGKVTRLDDIAPIIFLNRTKAALNCAAGYMQIDLKFEHPFYGIVYADFDRSSACTIAGNGTRTARIELPLKGCGTRQDPIRVFTNNIVVRFHPSLEMDGDEVITIVCRYPPPIAPPPPVVPVPLLPVQSPPETPLKGFQILLIVCGILFLSLVLLGLAASYYCLRNQRIQVIRRHPLPIAGAGSEITKISDSSTGALSMYEGLKIPRAHAHLTTTASFSESEMAIVSGVETIPSDYPSESPSTTHSEVEEMDGRSLRQSISSSGSYDNKAFVNESSYYSEHIGHISETEIARHRPPPPEPKFNVEMRVKKAPLPPPSPSPASSDTEGSVIAQERNLSTIHEHDETIETYERTTAPPPPTTFTYRPEIHSPPKSKMPPIYTEVTRKNVETKSELHEETAVDESEYHRTELSTDVNEMPVVVQRRPEVTSHFVDDVFLRTITEKKTIEDVERHRRLVTEYQAKPYPPPTKWDVEIRNYPNPNAPPPSTGDTDSTDWDTHSENSSVYGVPASSSRLYRTTAAAHRAATETTTTGAAGGDRYRTTLDLPVPNPPPPNWDALVKVLEPETTTSLSSETGRDRQLLTLDDKKKWRKIITTESTLRTMLTEATVREDYERIRRDQRYEKLFEPEKWEVIIRILTPPSSDRLFDQRGGGGGGSAGSSGGSNRYRRKSEWEMRSRRNSLPTLYEYDLDGGGASRNIERRNERTHEMHATTAFEPSSSAAAASQSRRTSRSSMRSDGADVRSMSEITVDFARQDVPDNMTDASSYYHPRGSRFYEDYDDNEYEDRVSLVRSLSQPSLARSASEFIESWGIRDQGWDSPEQSPRSSMRATTTTTTGVDGGDPSASSTYNVQRSVYQQQHHKTWYEKGGDGERL